MRLYFERLSLIVFFLLNFQVLFGQAVDDCGIVDGDGYVANCVDNTWGAGCTQMDCSGTCGGSALYQGYYSDVDVDTWGLSSAGNFCSHVDTDGVPTDNDAIENPDVSSYVLNNSDIDDDCKCGDTNLNTVGECYDECDICVGTGGNSGDVVYNGQNTDADCNGPDWDPTKCTVMDCAGVCGGNEVVGDYYAIDEDGDGLGVGSATPYCSSDALSSYILSAEPTNPFTGSQDDDCDNNSYDECGNCTGSNAAGDQPTADGYRSNCINNTWGAGCTAMDCSGTCLNSITEGDTAKWQGYYFDNDGDSW